jgi:N-acetyl-gamma-glutamyl-phosphate reductase
MKFKVFVDGQAGTTGLEIHQRLASRTDLELLEIDPERRKDPEVRKELLNDADIVFLCLPDAAARESASLVTNRRTRIIDASTAHRTDPDWAYGLPELSDAHRRSVETAARTAVPGCHATGFVLALYPLVSGGIVPPDFPVTAHSITGYSGGGRKLIEAYERPDGSRYGFDAPSHYALGLAHKHLPEMRAKAGLTAPPFFTPIVGSFYRGMAVGVPLHTTALPKKPNAKELHAALAEHYAGRRFVTVQPFESEGLLHDGYFDPTACNGTNRAEIFVFGGDTQAFVIVRLDNLGKGASGAAVQNMNIMLGLDEGLGLV